MTVERLERFAYKNGLEQGALQKAEEDAMNMLKKKYPVNDILEITGLTLEQVQELQKELAAQSVAAEA